MNCGECLMGHVKVVPLRPDGSCPCCERGHRDLADDGPEVEVIRRERAYAEEEKHAV